jgi:DNA repair protein recO
MAIHGEYDPKPVGNVSDACRYAWNFILTTPIEKLYRFTLKSEVFEELAGAVDQSMHRFIDRKMNSLEILRGIRP